MSDLCLSSTNLSTRAINMLVRNGILQLSELEECSSDRLIAMKGMGKKTLDKIIAFKQNPTGGDEDNAYSEIRDNFFFNINLTPEELKELSNHRITKIDMPKSTVATLPHLRHFIRIILLFSNRHHRFRLTSLQQSCQLFHHIQRKPSLNLGCFLITGSLCFFHICRKIRRIEQHKMDEAKAVPYNIKTAGNLVDASRKNFIFFTVLLP